MSADGPSSSRQPRRRWLRFSLAGMLFFVLCWAGLWGGFQVASRRVVLNPDPLRLTIVQRTSQPIPGLQGKAFVRLDDITAGQVLLSIEDNAKSTILSPSSVQKDDVIPFLVDGQEYFVHLVTLKNELVGDDFGIVEISTIDRWSKKP